MLLPKMIVILVTPPGRFNFWFNLVVIQMSTLSNAWKKLTQKFE